MKNYITKAMAISCLLAFAGAGFVSASNVYALESSNQIVQSVSQNTTEDVGLVGNLFCVGDGDAEHIALQWDTTLKFEKFVIYRSENAEDDFVAIYEGTGNSFEDDNVQIGKTYYYQLKVCDGSNEYYSKVVSLKPCKISDNLNTYDNQKGSSLVYGDPKLKSSGTNYTYSLKVDDGNAYLVERSPSGEERIVVDKNQNGDLANCKIESVQQRYMEKTGQVVIWAHWEKKDGYSDGKALVITGTPGGEFKVHHIYNPLGIQVRDMTIFVDDDQTAYLVAASNEEGQSANATISIFKMNDTYDDVTEVVKKVHENEYREFPNMMKKDGYYYLFTSQTAGWYPSAGGYSVTKDLYGDWSNVRSIGNSSTFSSQSGWIVNLNNQNYLMHAYRWLKASETSGTTLCPIYFANGFAFYDYYPSFKYNTATGELYPVQTGELLSQDKPVWSTIGFEKENNPKKAFDGSYKTSFVSTEKKWPYSLQTDLGEVCDLSNIQLSWYMCKGSEGYYTYTVEGSTDGENWTTILDHTDKNQEIVKNTYGFNSDMISGKARYVRINVKDATLHNNPNNNWYTPQVYEIKIFGTKAGENNNPKPTAEYNFESDTDVQLFGYAKIENDPEKGNVLSLDGNNGSYAKLPDGLIDGCNQFTISMDIKSESTGNFFIFGAGKDENKYFFLKVGQLQFKSAITSSSWQGESSVKYDMLGNSWHNYIVVVNGKTATAYLDGKPMETAEFTTTMSDLGNNLEYFIGKSFYSNDDYFKGSVDNVKIFREALNQNEINSLLNTKPENPDESSIIESSIIDSSENSSESSSSDSSIIDSSSEQISDSSSENDYMLGDLDFDGQLTSADALYILKNIVGITEFNQQEKIIADTNRDGSINTLDALQVLKAVVGLVATPL